MGIDIEHKREWTEEEIEIGNTKYGFNGIIVYDGGKTDFDRSRQFVIWWLTMYNGKEELGRTSLLAKDPDHISKLSGYVGRYVYVSVEGYTEYPQTCYPNGAPMTIDNIESVEVLNCKEDEVKKLVSRNSKMTDYFKNKDNEKYWKIE